MCSTCGKYKRKRRRAQRHRRDWKKTEQLKSGVIIAPFAISKDLR